MRKLLFLGLLCIAIATFLMIQTLSVQAQGSTPTPTPTATPKYWMGDPVVVAKDFVNPNTVTEDYYQIGPSDLNAARVGYYIPGVGYTIPNGAAFGDCTTDLDVANYSYCVYNNSYGTDMCTFFGLGAGNQSCNSGSHLDNNFLVSVTGNHVRVMYDALVYPIYKSSIEPAPEPPACITDTLSAVVNTGVISATVEDGYLLWGDLITNTNLSDIKTSVFRITTDDGPWSDGTNAYRFDVAYQHTSDDDWVPLGEYIADNDLCTYQDGVYTSVIITSTMTTRFRVNDVAGAFANNSGSMNLLIEAIYADPVEPGLIYLDYADGDMELTTDTYWDVSQTGSWGRIMNPYDKLFYPQPYCNNQLHAVGYADERNIGTYHQPISQHFYWPGGDMYYRWAVRRVAGIFDQFYDPPDYLVTIRQSYWPHDSWSFQDVSINNVWDTEGGYLADMIPGIYEINLDLVSNDYPVADTLAYDDVWISTELRSPCAGDPIPPTPTITPTPAGTPSDFRPFMDDCGFQYAGTQVDGWPWRYTDDAYLNLFSGNYYGHIKNRPGARIYQQKTVALDDGKLYMTYYVRGNYNVFLEYQGIQRLVDTGFYVDWTFRALEISLGDGGYFNAPVTFAFESKGGTPSYYAEFDQIYAANYYGTCQDNRIGQTPTPTPGGPTLTSTLIPTPVNTVTITPWPTYTPRPTSTQLPIYKTATSFVLTYTPAAGTATSAALTATSQWATATDLAATETAAQATATAQGTPAPPTATASATSTAFATQTPVNTPTETMEPPEQQPPGVCNANCQRPLNALSADWINYAICRGEKYIAYCPYHSATLTSIDSQFSDREPFNTINDVKLIATEVNSMIGQYDWTDTGTEGSDELPDYAMILTPQANNPYVTGIIDLTPDEDDFSTSCEMRLENLVGPVITMSMCWAFDVANTVGYIPWVNMMMNLFIVFTFGVYIKKAWVDTGVSS